MNRLNISRMLLLSGLLAALIPLAGPAQADIVKCVNGAGHATLTDQPCAANEVATRLEEGGTAPAQDASANAQPGAQADSQPADATPEASEVIPAPASGQPALTRVALPAGESALPPSQWKANLAVHRPAARAFALDAATLKAARLSMQLMDEEEHQQKLASR